MARNRPKAHLREELKRSNRKSTTSFFIIATLVVMIGVLAGFLYWRFFVNQNFEASELAPQDAELFMVLDWQEESQQNQNLNNISLGLGGPTTLQSLIDRLVGRSYSNTSFTFRDDITPWLGEELAVFRRNQTEKDKQTLLFSVADDVKKSEFLTKLEDESDTLNADTYKGYKVNSLFGTKPTAYAEIGNFVVIAEKPQAVQEVIDVVAGDIDSLKTSPDFELAEKNVNTDALFFGFVDVSPFFRAPAKLGIDPGIAINLDEQARLGMTIGAEENGFSLQLFIPDAGQEVKNNFTPDILSVIPNDVVSYLGGTNIAGFAEEYLSTILGIPTILEKNITRTTLEDEYGVSLEEDLFSWMRGEYALAHLDDETDDFALIFNVDDAEVVREKLLKLENAISGLVNTFSKEQGELNFTESGDGIRYVSIPGESGYVLNYGFKDDYVVFATSRVAIDEILNPGDDFVSLRDSKKYELVASEFPNEESSGAFYLSGPFLIEFVDTLGFNFTAFERHIIGLGFQPVNIEDGTLLTGFLPVL